MRVEELQAIDVAPHRGGHGGSGRDGDAVVVQVLQARQAAAVRRAVTDVAAHPAALLVQVSKHFGVVAVSGRAGERLHLLPLLRAQRQEVPQDVQLAELSSIADRLWSKLAMITKSVLETLQVAFSSGGFHDRRI